VIDVATRQRLIGSEQFDHFHQQRIEALAMPP